MDRYLYVSMPSVYMLVFFWSYFCSLLVCLVCFGFIVCLSVVLSSSGSHWWVWSLAPQSAHLQLICSNQHTHIYPDQPSRQRWIVESVTVRKRQPHLTLFLCFGNLCLPVLCLATDNQTRAWTLPTCQHCRPEPWAWVAPPLSSFSENTCQAKRYLLWCFQ